MMKIFLQETIFRALTASFSTTKLQKQSQYGRLQFDLLPNSGVPNQLTTKDVHL